MGNRAETFRRELIGSGDALRLHSMSQRVAKVMIERRERGVNRKADRASERKRREEEFLEDLPELQFNRSLRHMLDGVATGEDIAYVLRNINQYENVVEKVRVGKRRHTVTITVVDLPIKVP